MEKAQYKCNAFKAREFMSASCIHVFLLSSVFSVSMLSLLLSSDSSAAAF